jgi:hypothetical protein
MNPKLIALFSFLLISFSSFSQISLKYYLPDNVEYDSSIPTPKEVLGYEVGEWHVSHDQLVYYMKEIARASNRITIEEYGRTHENRPLLLLTVTSPENHKNISNIKEEHKKLTNPELSQKLDISNMPAVIWMGYSVHGNEPSGSNASLLVAYYLAAAKSSQIDDLIKNNIILIDPSINPDGLNRFASWVNSHKSKNLIADPLSRELNEIWPKGRTNHYWFDLNRDWLPAQHPESQGRITKFQDWKPNILTDHHEMGTNSSFFFQPGIPSRNHPLTPENNYKLTRKMAAFHAEALDKIGAFYFTEESYDDFYYGKGSTYPDVQGAVGILFEQASSRGHLQESINGLLSFPFTIRNQFTTSLSSLKASNDMREELLAYQRDFYIEAVKEAKKNTSKAIIFGTGKDPFRAYHLAEMISRHDIDIYSPAKEFTANGKKFSPNNSYIIPLEQPQNKLIQAMFEIRTKFQDSLFYDISAWTLPLAFNADYEELNNKAFNASLLGEKFDVTKNRPSGKISDKSEYAYIFEWHGYYAPKALNQLMENGVQVKISTEKFFTGENKLFDYGTILIPVVNQKINSQDLYELLQKIAFENGIEIYGLRTGLTPKGINLGSPSFLTLKKPEIMILTEGGVSSYDAGEIWHLFDQKFDIKASMVTLSTFNKSNIDRYNTIILSDGSYSEIGAAGKEKLKAWVQKGGIIIALQGGAKWLGDNGISNVKYKKTEADTLKQRPYADLIKNAGAQVIGGAIFNTRLDLSHPLGYGYEKPELPVFRNNAYFMEKLKNPYSNPLMYTSSPLASGYISKENLNKLRNTAAISVTTIGTGKIISFADNPNFRAFWYGTNKLFLNAVFLGQTISNSSYRGED